MFCSLVFSILCSGLWIETNALIPYFQVRRASFLAWMQIVKNMNQNIVNYTVIWTNVETGAASRKCCVTIFKRPAKCQPALAISCPSFGVRVSSLLSYMYPEACSAWECLLRTAIFSCVGLEAFSVLFLWIIADVMELSSSFQKLSRDLPRNEKQLWIKKCEGVSK